MVSKEKEIYGLVLSGGKSTRMGHDKGLITYHGMPQREYLYQLLDQVCTETFMGIREDQQDDIPSGFHTIIDEVVYRGPFNGMLSAHKAYPDVAWLVVACDLPLVDLASLKTLIAQRNPDARATAYALEGDPLPEPLFAIWEADALQEAIQYLEAGNGSCPRKYLINSETHLVFPENSEVLLNANSEEEYKEALKKMG